MKRCTPILPLLFLVQSCAYYFEPPKVKKSFSTEYTYVSNKHGKTSKWKKRKKPGEYKLFDKNGNLIEKGEYGEVGHFSKTIREDDSTFSIMCGTTVNDKKLNTVTYFSYNQAHQLVAEESWSFHDNHKNRLVYKKTYGYIHGKLADETYLDENDQVIEKKEYDSTHTVQVSDGTIFLPNMVIQTGEKSVDTTRCDQQGRIREKIHYRNGVFLYRQEFLYSDDGTIMTELRYDDEPDHLWCIQEEQYDIITHRLKRTSWKVINSTTEERHEYIYNRKLLLKKINHYNRNGLTGYTLCRYRLQ